MATPAKTAPNDTIAAPVAPVLAATDPAPSAVASRAVPAL